MTKRVFRSGAIEGRLLVGDSPAMVVVVVAVV